MASFWERLKENATFHADSIGLSAEMLDSRAETIKPAEVTNFRAESIIPVEVPQLSETDLIMAQDLRLSRAQAQEIASQREVRRQELARQEEFERLAWREELEATAIIFAGSPVVEVPTSIGAHDFPKVGYGSLEGAHFGEQAYVVGLTKQLSDMLHGQSGEPFARLVTLDKADQSTSPLEVIRRGLPMGSEISIGQISGREFLGVFVGEVPGAFASTKPDRLARRVLALGNLTEQGHIDPKSRLIIDFKTNRP